MDPRLHPLTPNKHTKQKRGNKRSNKSNAAFGPSMVVHGDMPSATLSGPSAMRIIRRTIRYEVDFNDAIPITSFLDNLDGGIRATSDWVALAQVYSQYRVRSWRVSYTPPNRYGAGTGVTNQSGLALLFLYAGGAGTGIPPSSRAVVLTDQNTKAFQPSDPWTCSGPVYPLVGSSTSEILWGNTALVPVNPPWGVFILNGMNYYTPPSSVINFSGSYIAEMDVEFRETL